MLIGHKYFAIFKGKKKHILVTLLLYNFSLGFAITKNQSNYRLFTFKYSKIQVKPTQRHFVTKMFVYVLLITLYGFDFVLLCKGLLQMLFFRKLQAN